MGDKQMIFGNERVRYHHGHDHNNEHNHESNHSHGDTLENKDEKT